MAVEGIVFAIRPVATSKGRETPRRAVVRLSVVVAALVRSKRVVVSS